MPDRAPFKRDIADIKIESNVSPFWQKEQTKALSELEKSSLFQCLKLKNGPFSILLKKEGRKLVFEIKRCSDDVSHTVIASFSPYRRIIQDYFLLIESYEQVRVQGDLQKLEAIDMGRRGLHNEGAEMLQERLADHIKMNHETARLFFTLICTLWHN